VTQKFLFVKLSAVLFATGLFAFPSGEKKPIASPGTPGVTGVAAQPSGGKKEDQPPVLERRNPRYKLCAGDAMDLDFPFVPEFSQQGVMVQPDGFITLRGIGDLHVEGQTVPELTESLRKAYAKILHDPVITVVLWDFDKPYFIASGQVEHPGKYDLRGDTTVTEGLAIAGGLNDKAKHSQVLLFRRVSNDWYEVKKVNVKRVLQARNLNEDLHLQPGDMLFVPTSTVGNIKRFVPSTGMGMYYNPHP
jgi:polysaccharide export outer membrane protein